LVFGVFIISSSIVVGVAVWNLSIVQGNVRYSFTSVAAASYLIAVASMGLLVIFPIIFLEIIGKRTFLGAVWFELSWVGLFGLMTLIGASLITSLSSRELCAPPSIVQGQLVTSAILVSPCSSAQVLGVFTWMPAIFLIAYATLLSIIAIVQSREDSTVWKCAVRDVVVDKILGEVKRRSAVFSLPPIHKSPVIHAPRPRYIIPPLLDCNSARNSAYDGPVPVSLPKPAPVREMKSWYRTTVSQGPYTGFYNTSVQKAMGAGPLPPLPLRVDKAGPRPLGDWPRLDATTRPRAKRRDRADPQAQFLPVRQQRSTAPQRPPPSSTTTTRTPFVERSTVISPGRGNQFTDIGGRRPPPLDLSEISTHRTRSQRSRARAGR